MDSILETIKEPLGVKGQDSFNTDIIMHINTAFFVLWELGVGPEKPFVLYDKHQYWDEFMEDSVALEMVKSYIYLKVKLVFDPPTNGTVIELMKEQIDEFEWRLREASEHRNQNGGI